MERYVAVDNVCAWPNLVKMPDDRLVVTIFNQPCHGKWAGDVECWESGDEGRVWTRCGVPAPHEPETNRMNVAAGLARNGDLIVLSSGWSDRSEKGSAEPRDFDESCVLPCWVCRSTDNGRTWSHTESVANPPGIDYVIPFGKIIALPDGALGVTAYSSRQADDRRIAENWFYRSLDDGQTWGESVPIGSGYNETDILHAGDRRLLAAARTQKGARLDLMVSEDLGATWAYRQALTNAMQLPAHLLKLRSGSILLAYGIREHGAFGLGARLSEDNGQSWSTPWVLISFDDADDGGYPSSVELEDGSICTVYYANRVSAHTRYHMGALRWNIQEQVALNQ